MLGAMFPDTDAGVLQVILADCDNNVEAAAEMLLEMSAGGSGGGGGDDNRAVMEAGDAELAELLMMQFALDMEEEFGESIPPEIAADPVKYNEYVAKRLEELAKQQPDKVNRLMDRTVERNQNAPAVQAGDRKTGFQGFLSRLKAGGVKTTATPIRSTSTRVKVVAVGNQRNDDKRTSLLSDQDHTEESI